MTTILVAFLIGFLWFLSWKYYYMIFARIAIVLVLCWGSLFTLTADTVAARTAIASKSDRPVGDDYRDGVISTMRVFSKIRLHIICPLILLGFAAFISTCPPRNVEPEEKAPKGVTKGEKGAEKGSPL